MPMCPYCHTVVSGDHQSCPECGRPLAGGEVIVGGSGDGKSKKKQIGILVACVIAIIIITLLSTGALTPTYTLSVRVNPLAAGSVSPMGGEYKSGVYVVLTASPANGYYFDSWSGSASGTTASVAITMDSDNSVTANFATSPQPRFTDPGTGAAVGRVLFPDNEPASGTIVYIFKILEIASSDICWVDTNGYYIFDNLPVGLYDIYIASATGPPDLTITVSEHETNNVRDLFALRDIEITFDNPKVVMRPGFPETSKYIIDGHNPMFTWDNVQDALYYEVSVWSTDTGSQFPNFDYDESHAVFDNTIAWPTSLSSTPYQEFKVVVEAYIANGKQIASGDALFVIDNPPEGWVYK